MVVEERKSGSVMYIKRMMHLDAGFTIQTLCAALKNMAVAHGQSKIDGETLLQFADYIIEDLGYEQFLRVIYFINTCRMKFYGEMNVIQIIDEYLAKYSERDKRFVRRDGKVME